MTLRTNMNPPTSLYSRVHNGFVRLFFLLGLTLPLLMLTACTAKKTSYEQAVVNAPASWVSQQPPVAVQSGVSIMREPRLQSFIKEAVDNNFSLQAMAMRVHRANALFYVATGERYPSVSASFNVNKGETRGGTEEGRHATREYQPVGSISWELDLWGKLKDRAKAAEREYDATVMDWQAARFSLCSQIAKAWYRGITSSLLLRQAENVANSYKKTLEAVEGRYQRGLAESLDVYMARTAKSQARTLLEARRTEHTLAIQALQILAGHYPDGHLQLPRALPTPVAHIATTFPADLVTNRYDLQASIMRIEAADKEWSAALKEMLPTITLSAQTGTDSKIFADSLDPRFGFWQLIAGISQPIFAGKRLRSKARESEFGVYQLQLEHCNLLLNSFHEVEATLASQQSLKKQYSEAKETARHAESAWITAVEQYKLGTTDLLTVLVNQRQHLQSMVETTELENAVLQNSVDLITALGASNYFLPKTAMDRPAIERL